MKFFIERFKNDFPYISAIAILFSFIGWVVENASRAISYGIIDNRFHILPFIPVYGFIAIAAYVFGNPDKLSIFGISIIKSNTKKAKLVSNIALILICLALTFIGELAVGNLWENVFGVVLWNYEAHPLHLTKYVSIYSVIGFGFGAYLMLKLLYYPVLFRMKNKISSNHARIYPVLYGILIVDMLFMMLRTSIEHKAPIYWTIDLNNGFPYLAVIEGILVTAFLVFLILFIFVNLSYLKPKEKLFGKGNEDTRFAILIPARDESRVIKATLDALMKSNYDKEFYDVYVMVSSFDDPTLEICKNYSNVYSSIRKTSTIGKGYVLDEMVHSILDSNKKYDAYLLLDADNLVESNFLRNMSNAFRMNYDIVVGNRSNKNPNASATSGASGITFTVINYMNSMKSRNNEMVLLTGTGFCIRSSIINAEGGWPFHSLTEDYELSKYARLHGLSSAYVKDAVFYDEQPIKLSDSIKQRTRWIKGFISNNKEKNSMTASGVFGFGIAISYISFILFNLVLGMIELFKGEYTSGFKFAIIGLVFYYIVVVVLSLIIFIVDRKQSKICFFNAIRSSLFHPIFLASYLVSFARVFKKGHEWEIIPHSVNKL